MIFYFSGTGNSRWVAEQLALKTDDLAVDIIKDASVLKVENQCVGLIFPIHAWGVPEPMLTFANNLVGKPAFSFGLCTCGGEAGLAMQKLSKVFHLDSVFSIEMPNNYVIGSDVESEAEIISKIANAKKKLNKIAGQVIARAPVNDVQSGNFAWVKSNVVNIGFNFAARSTKPFLVTDKCISCGQCADECPAKTIRMVNGKPEWGKECYQCMACINRCPTKAIEYGKGTATRKRYIIEDYLTE